MCKYCRSDLFKTSQAVHVVDYKGSIIIIKNAPCEECVSCGEKYYTDEVANKLEEIVNKAKAMMLELSVMDYAKQGKP